MLKNLKINKEKVIVEYPQFNNFKLELCYIPREELAEIRKNHATTSFDRKTRQPKEDIDTDGFMEEYIGKALQGWSGLTYRIVKSLVPASIDEALLDQEIPFSKEDALWLIKNSSEFDSFISDTMNNVDVFSVVKKQEQLKK